MVLLQPRPPLLPLPNVQRPEFGRHAAKTDVFTTGPLSALFPGPQRRALSSLRQEALGKVDTFLELRELS